MAELIKTQQKDDNFIIKLGSRIDISNAKAVEAEIKEAIKDKKDSHLILDAADLDYISSAGIRIFIALKKIHGDVKIVNAGLTVYEILEVTAVDQIIPVSKKRREFDTNGLDVIGKGATGTVYRLDDETILKVFVKGMDESLIEKERELAQKTFLMDIPTAIPFDIVQVGENTGLIYELIPSDSFLRKIVKNPENLDKYAKEFGVFLKGANSVQVDKSEWNNARATLVEDLELLKPYVIPQDFEKLEELLESIPEGDTFIHGDAHPDNILVTEDGPLFIDLFTVGYGHPILDLMSVAAGLVNTANPLEEPDDEDFDQRTQLKWKQRKALWRGFLKGYFDTDNEDYIDRIEKQILGRAFLRNALMIVKVFGNNENFDRYKNSIDNKIQYALKVADELEEPVFF